ncbi:YIP1 family protein [Paenibacillus polysaccharolyticus]|uniref:YIP1 family protein n=1 Tax=Paenibacillus cucumis (ex Kampfer et al. 2016) TaxID=1776858 RepID=A0ABS7KIZ5_9BACL|nr:MULTISPECIES: YIP1 family protein [Paenibacillus]MBY0204094.1 YIP1 family protein [Paenibacillus cucumis (ex Kampfer et al. 2016)]MCP1133943.1 YIP1 family protein [Paenibacillus polysaccharolyticus]MDP9697871.1 ABC-type multidrug transport system fused ATPase/permease subunit [Paenibacillus intestini]MDT0122872.1 YIP1 family protein [Paenibacillus sp. RRE4]
MQASSKQLYQYPLHLIFHPFDGYWELKYERNQKTTLLISLMIMVLLVFTKILQAQYSGFLINFNNPKYLNSLLEMVYVVIPVLFWCVANWSLTTLMDGEGKFSEIFMSTCFALVPMFLVHFPWIWLSLAISAQETAFYYFSNAIAVCWTVYLLFVGNMTVHQYTPAKTILTMLLTLVAMAFMAFLCLLFFSLVQQIVSFVYTIYQELVLRG